MEIARKNHKTFTSAVIFIILMLTEPRFARLFSVAPDYKLSSELRLAVRKIILVSPMLSKHFKITRDMITCKLTDIEYTPLAYSNDRLDGRLANAFLADEDGTMDSYPVEAMTSSQVTLTRKLGIIISTQYPNNDNDFSKRIDIAKKILDGMDEIQNFGSAPKTVKMKFVISAGFLAEPLFLCSLTKLFRKEKFVFSLNLPKYRKFRIAIHHLLT